MLRIVERLESQGSRDVAKEAADRERGPHDCGMFMLFSNFTKPFLALGIMEMIVQHQARGVFKLLMHPQMQVEGGKKIRRKAGVVVEIDVVGW